MSKIANTTRQLAPKNPRCNRRILLPLSYGLPILIGALLACTWYSTISAALLVLFPAGWLGWRTRRQSICFVLSFYLALNWEMIPDSERFFTSLSMGASMAIWLSLSLAYTLPWAILYTRRSSWVHISSRIALVTLLLLLPPLGYFIWLQPIASSGMLYPDCGISGILLTCLLMIAIGCLIKGHRQKPLLFITLALLFISIVANGVYQPSSLPNHWIAIQTHLGKAPKSLWKTPQREQQLIVQANQQLQHGNHVILFPENVALDWLSGTAFQWQHTVQLAKTHHAVILLGAQQDLASGEFNNVLIPLGDITDHPYPARQPMPFGLWKPWTTGSYHRHWESSGKFTLKHHVALYLICYEMMIPWPIIQPFLQAPKPTIIFSAANQWFSTPSGYTKQHNNLLLFARLFGVPTLTAVNR